MANRIKELKTHALEISKKSGELKEQKKINMRDLSINDELRGIGVADETDRSGIESVSKAVTGERTLIEGRVNENQKDIDKTAGEADDYINSLKGNVRKMEQMRKASNLADVGGQVGETKGRIAEGEGVKRILKTAGGILGACVAGAGGAVSPLRNEFRENVVPETVPAVYAHLEGNFPTTDDVIQNVQRQYPEFTIKSAPEEKQPGIMQKIGELGQNVQDIMEGFAEIIEKKR